MSISGEGKGQGLLHSNGYLAHCLPGKQFVMICGLSHLVRQVTCAAHAPVPGRCARTSRSCRRWGRPLRRRRMRPCCPRTLHPTRGRWPGCGGFRSGSQVGGSLMVQEWGRRGGQVGLVCSDCQQCERFPSSCWQLWVCCLTTCLPCANLYPAPAACRAHAEAQGPLPRRAGIR